MKKTSLLAVLLTVALSSTIAYSAFAQARTAIDGTNETVGAMAMSESRSTTVIGQGKVSVKPDKAIVNLSMESLAATAQEAQQKGKEDLKKLNDMLGSLGIKPEDIQTSWYNIYPQVTYPENGERKIMGYTVNHSLNVNVSDLNKVSDVLDKITQVGTVNVGGVSYTLDNQESAKDKAREMAASDAKAKAGKLGGIFDFEIGKVMRVSDINMDYGPIYSGKGMTADNSLQPGNIDVMVNLEVTFSIN